MNPRKLLLGFSGVIFGAFLVVQDEILTEAMYCGVGCRYPYPLIGSFTLYGAESIADAVMLGSLALAWWARRDTTKDS